MSTINNGDLNSADPTTCYYCYSLPVPPSRKLLRILKLAALATLLLSLASLLSPRATRRPAQPQHILRSRGPSDGVSEKSTGLLPGSSPSFPWTNNMLRWQRTAFHFQPQLNWMNAPLYYKGWYHLFYQYNPDSAVWGNITWGHAVSRDLIHWLLLPLAMVPNHWYDSNGVWTGSATLLSDGQLVVLYTGSTDTSIQVQNLAFPSDPDDPLLINWLKSESNPVLLPPPGVGLKDFRDPTTAWFVRSDSAWRVAIGSKDVSAHAGIVLVYKTEDWLSYQLLPGMMHRVNGTGMWECVDFYPVSTSSAVGLDTSTPTGPEVKHVLKASLDDNKHDYYAIGIYDEGEDKWTPDNEEMDVGIGLRLDYGKYYASKTFFDQKKQRRVLWGWVGETDTETTDLRKGWASVQSVPRTVLFDIKTGSNLLQWPVEEVESLRLAVKDFDAMELPAGSVVPLNITGATQLDISAEFEVESSSLVEAMEADVGYNCSMSAGAAGRGVLGPFGLIVLADEDLSEQTAIYLYIARGIDGGLSTFFCLDELRSSKANDVLKRVYGSTVPLLEGETLSVRILVDHSVVESFAQGGRTCITSRIYPTKAIYGDARVFLFNNATGARVTSKSLRIWEMDNACIHPYPFGQ
ncbi:hypothetical protein J5N97_001947 [Dioscorea zingiberensis]|uniref:Beta-fructofuranosidase n=1 Tax=Dioscorea zingiberensis TaxID=325984 RepID=A0A9D5BTD0_9LILI|nr:hypothetical protein J5N97_001947 [Dioscorea zingiberensis]